MSIHLLTNFAELEACQDQWNSVSGNRPFHSWEWCANWLLHFEQDAKPFVIVEQNDDGLWKSIAPMALYKTKFGENKLAFMGNGATCSDYANLITSPENYPAFAKQFSDWFVERNQNKEASRIEVLEFDGMEADASNVGQLKNILQKRGFRLHSIPLENCWRIKLTDSWEQLNQTFSKKHRRKTKKAVQRLAEPGLETSFASNSFCTASRVPDPGSRIMKGCSFNFSMGIFSSFARG